MKKLVLLTTLLLILPGVVLAATQEEIVAALQAGGEHVVSLQDTEGDHAGFWFWPHNPGEFAAFNTAAPIGIGLLEAYQATGDASFLEAAILTGDGLLARGVSYETRFASFDALFLVRLSQVTGNPVYQDKAADFFADLVAGEAWGRDPDLGCASGDGSLTTAEYITCLQTIRSGGQINIRPWDFAAMAIAAQMVGAENADELAAAFEDGISTLNPDLEFYLIGLDGAIWGRAVLGGDTSSLAATLLGFQDEDGKIGETQDTAYAIIALTNADSEAYAEAISAAVDFLIANQLENGGWFWDYPEPGEDPENVEVEGEVLWALGLQFAPPGLVRSDISFQVTYNGEPQDWVGYGFNQEPFWSHTDVDAFGRHGMGLVTVYERGCGYRILLQRGDDPLRVAERVCAPGSYIIELTELPTLE